MSSYRRESVKDLYASLERQDDDNVDPLGWLNNYFVSSQEDKPHNVQPLHQSMLTRPGSVISSGSSSSASSRNSPAAQARDESDDEDSGSDSDSDVEPMSLDVSYPKTAYDASYITYLSNPSPVSELKFHPSSPLPAPRPIIARRMAPPPVPKSIFAPHPRPIIYDDEVDAEGEEESVGNASDDEYVPSPTLAPLKRRTASRSPSCSPQQSRASSSSCGPSPAKRARPAPPSRNIQASSSSASSFSSSKSNPWACPHCSWVQRNHRSPDLKRHIRTHTRHEDGEQWGCWGIPVHSAAEYSISVSKHEPTVDEWGAPAMVGGCGKTFSRRDALKRHLDNGNIGCVGDIGSHPRRGPGAELSGLRPGAGASGFE